MIDRIKNKIQERKEEKQKEKIIDTLSLYCREKINCYWLIRKLKIDDQKEKYINYQLRNLKRKVNIALKMEEEDRIENINEISEKYYKIIKEQM